MIKNSDKNLNNEFNITSDFITLGQLLKHFNITATGGEAKMFLSNNTVFVNGIKDDRRGRKLYPGDEVKIGENIFKVCMSKK